MAAGYPTNLPNMPCIMPFSKESIGVNRPGSVAVTTPATAVWPSANRALYIPFTLNRPYVVRRLFWANGTTVSGNVDVGIYLADQTKVLSTGSTAQATISVIQSVSVTETVLAPGNYFMALVMDNATGHIIRVANPNANQGKALGYAEQATAFPLPSTATMATYATSAITHVFGLTSRTVI